jgi:predicted nucleic acid-binding protein
MINLFIDTNIYLRLYLLEEEVLQKFVKRIRDKKITLWLPEQVINEFFRNRENELNYHVVNIENIIDKKIEGRIPKIPDCEDELKQIKEAQKTIEEEKKKITSILEGVKKKIKNKIKENAFFADQVIEQLFSLAIKIDYDEKIINRANIRNNLGNPPGKVGDYGDAIIWESLLEAIPEEVDLYFVGSDNHFKSKVDEDDFSPFLEKEWKEKKRSKIISFKKIGEFFKDQIPEIEKPDKIIKEELTAYQEAMRNMPAAVTAYQEAMRNMPAAVTAYQEAMRNMPAIVTAYQEAMRNMPAVYQAFHNLYILDKPKNNSTNKDKEKQFKNNE